MSPQSIDLRGLVQAERDRPFDRSLACVHGSGQELTLFRVERKLLAWVMALGLTLVGDLARRAPAGCRLRTDPERSRRLLTAARPVYALTGGKGRRHRGTRGASTTWVRRCGGLAARTAGTALDGGHARARAGRRGHRQRDRRQGADGGGGRGVRAEARARRQARWAARGGRPTRPREPSSTTGRCRTGSTTPSRCRPIRPTIRERAAGPERFSG